MRRWADACSWRRQVQLVQAWCGRFRGFHVLSLRVKAVAARQREAASAAQHARQIMLCQGMRAWEVAVRTRQSVARAGLGGPDSDARARRACRKALVRWLGWQRSRAEAEAEAAGRAGRAAKGGRRATAREEARTKGVELRRSRSRSVAGGMGAGMGAGVEAGVEACAAALAGRLPPEAHAYSGEEARNTIISVCSKYVAGCSGLELRTGGGGLGRQQRKELQYAQLRRTKELQAQSDAQLLGLAAQRECRSGACPRTLCHMSAKGVGGRAEDENGRRDRAAPPGGKEVVSRFVTNLYTAGEMLTDSNGREMMLRARANASGPEPVASSYFPVTTAAAIRGPLKQLTLLVDRAAGAASLAEGQIEIMVHRRLLTDDDCGVAEPLNETRYVDELGRHSGPGLISRGTHRLTLERPTRASRVWRPLADRTYARPLLAFASTSTPAAGKPAEAGAKAGADGAPPRAATPPPANVSALRVPLPDHVQLVTLQELRPGRLLLRLAHQLAIGEDAALAQPARVNLATLFDPAVLRLERASRRSLTNSHNESELMRRRQRAKAWHTSGQPHAWRQLTYNFSADATVTLGPMEIHTFELELRPVDAR